MSAFGAELVKVRTLRSTYWTLGATVAVGGGLAYLVGRSFRDNEGYNFDAVFATFYGLTMAQLALVVFAVFAVGGEYSAGTIRPTLAAVPNRGRYYLAKVGVVGLYAAGAAALTVGAAYVAGGSGLGARRLGPQWEPILGAFLYLVLIALLAAGIAQLLRSSTAALAVQLPLFFLESQGLGNIPGLRKVAQFLPNDAGLAVLHFFGAPGTPRYDRAFPPWGGVAILALWAAAALIGGYITLHRRDA
ncbi:hypothetical protein [Dactylosporangium sp. NPDC051541]|uniref:hypothetical protein n=1 Tax=Dactylosporangium sp. NPDC051541 TaxID=3363977 RepID=UPI00379F4FD5